jgi:hypothetical protein
MTTINFLFSLLISSGVIIYVAKLVVDKLLEAALQKYNSNLEIIKIEHQIKFSKIYEEKAEKVKELYQSLYELEKSLLVLTTCFQGPEWSGPERTNQSIEKRNICVELLEKNRIYFTDSFSDILNGTFLECNDVIAKMQNAKFREQMQREARESGVPASFKDGKRALDIWREQEEKVLNDIRNRRIALVAEFRNILGVDNAY